MAHNTDNLDAPKDAKSIRVLADSVEFWGSDSILGMSSRDSGNDLAINLLPTGPAKDVEDHVNDTQKQLVDNVASALESTMKRIGESFEGYLTMNRVLFWVGVLSFVTAVVKGLWSPDRADAIVAAAFGGLSATTFIVYFLSRPLAAMASAGPEAAWLLATVNTYWSKLIYLNDPTTFVKDIEAAQRDLEKSMALYLRTVSYGKRAEPVDPKDGTPEHDHRGQGHDKPEDRPHAEPKDRHHEDPKPAAHGANGTGRRTRKSTPDKGATA